MIENQSLVEIIKGWLNNCPLFNDNEINVEYLPAEIGYAIYPRPTKIKSSTFIDGQGGVYQYPFDLVCNENIDGMIESSIANSRFFEDLQEWVMEQVSNSKFPIISNGEILDIYITNTAYFQDMVNTGLGQYVISFILEYEKGVK